MQGVYKITNKRNNKIYVGSSNNILYRWSQHLNELYNNIHANERLQQDFNLYGIESFSFEILELILDSNKLLSKEQKYIIDSKSYLDDIGYNVIVNTKINTTKSSKNINKISINTENLYKININNNSMEQLRNNLKIIEVKDVFKKNKIIERFNNRYAVTKSWLDDEENANITRNLLLNYIKHIKKLKTNELYWCTFCSKQKVLQGKGYIKSFIPMNCDIDIKRNNLIFAVNNFLIHLKETRLKKT